MLAAKETNVHARPKTNRARTQHNTHAPGPLLGALLHGWDKRVRSQYRYTGKMNGTSSDTKNDEIEMTRAVPT